MKTESRKITTYKPKSGFNWQQCWYPVTFAQDLNLNKPYSFSLYDEPFVIFTHNNELVCLSDRCSHRAAKLSDGRLIDRKIECLYHGWQFESNGQCAAIPQLAASATIPRNACIPTFKIVEHQGIIWLWRGKPETADETQIPVSEAVAQAGVVVIDTVTDLPYDQNYLVENLLDPAHVPISHDRTELKMKREDAQPLEMEILAVSARGFKGRYRNTKTNRYWANLEFVAPGAVLYSFGNTSLGIIGGLALYALPWGQGRSRLLVRRYGNFFDWRFKNTPRWLEHLRQNKILEEDLDFIRGQEAYIKQSEKSIKETYLPLKTIDTFVMEHRKWLDKFGQELPYYQGYNTAKITDNFQDNLALDRFTRHTQLCSSCSQAYRNINLFQQGFFVLAIAFIILAIITKDFFAIQATSVIIFFIAISLSFSLKKFKTHFEQNFKR